MGIDSKFISTAIQRVEPKADTQGKSVHGSKEKKAGTAFECLLKDMLKEPADLKSIGSENHLQLFWKNHCVYVTLNELGAFAGEKGMPGESFLSSIRAYSLLSNCRRSFADVDGSLSSTPFDSIIEEAAKRYGVDSALIRSVIQVESAFRVDAVSPKGAMGLMQLMPETARELGVHDPYDPVENIMAGACYLRKLIDRYSGNLIKALAAYNWGPGNVEKYPHRIPEETRDYVTRVLRLYSSAV